jgi:hypothetical protein
MDQPQRRELVALALTVSIVLSLVAVPRPIEAVSTSVDGPDEVQKPDAFTFESTVTIRDDERVPLRNYTVTLWPEGSPDETVSVTFAPNGTVLAVSPRRGVIGAGEIRINQLRRTVEITPADWRSSYGYGYGYDRDGYRYGYGYGYGLDERTGERVEFGYGYGYGGPSTVSFEITLGSRAFRQGSYRLRTSVSTPERTGLFRSNVETFEVTLPRGGGPPGGGGDDAEGGDGDEDGRAPGSPGRPNPGGPNPNAPVTDRSSVGIGSPSRVQGAAGSPGLVHG